MDAIKHQGLTCGQVGHKSRDALSEEESGRQVQRYIRLTHLIPEILQMVDDGRIALTPAVELSYLNEWEQRDLLETMLSEDCTPSLSQAIHMKHLSQAGKLDMDTIFEILTQLKPNQQEKISFRVSELRSYFPRSYTASQMTQDILKGLELLRQRREQNRDSR
jgi:ParB family chromosome partitioning protein